MKQEIDNNAMWAAFRQELALQGEVHVVAAIDNALNNLGFTIEETSTIIPISLKQGEKKPIEWSEEDKKMLEKVIANIECPPCTTANYKPIREMVDWLKSLQGRYVSQIKQEWSEEDEAMWAEISDLLWEGYKQSGSKFSWDDIRNWFNPKLKSLKNRIQLQPEQEWSKNDEIALADALWCCKQAASIAKDENDMGNIWFAENWLKSLKPQSQWKPSDRQMVAINTAINVLGKGTLNGKELIKLQKQLKKLREE